MDTQTGTRITGSSAAGATPHAVRALRALRKPAQRRSLGWRIVTTTGWVAVVALGGASLIPAPEAHAAGIVQRTYVVAESTASASQTTAPLRRAE